MQDLANDYRRKLAEAVTAVMGSIKDAVEKFDAAMLEAETEFTAATNARMRMFNGELEPKVEAPAPQGTLPAPSIDQDKRDE